MSDASTGSNPAHQHDTDCSQVIHQIFTFIDNEMPQADCAVIQKHLDECGPCLAKYDLERTVKSLVARSCSEQAPNDLREKVLFRIREVQISIDARLEDQ